MNRKQCWHIYDGETLVGFVCDRSEEAAQRYANSIVPNAVLSPILREYIVYARGMGKEPRLKPTQYNEMKAKEAADDDA